MPRRRPSSLQETAEFGIDVASKISGAPEHVLRIHVDQGLVAGVRKTAGGHRRISREGLLAYMRTHGYDPKRLERLDRRGAERIWTNQPRRVRLAYSHPRFAGNLGKGEGTLVDLSRTGFQLKGLSWKGALPGPESLVHFRILGGELKGTQGTVSLGWILYRGKDFRMGLKLERLSDPGARGLWKAHVLKAIETRQRMAEALLSKN